MVFMTIEKRQPRRAISTKHRKISTGLDLELYIVVETSSGSLGRTLTPRERRYHMSERPAELTVLLLCLYVSISLSDREDCINITRCFILILKMVVVVVLHWSVARVSVRGLFCSEQIITTVPN